MKKITDKEILQHLSNGVTQLTQEKADDLWNQPVEQAAGNEWYLQDQRNKRRPVRKSSYIGAIAACLVLCVFASILFPLMPSASVYLDVNPSISLSVNYHNRVTGVNACNADAERVLGDLDFRGTDLDVALYAILGSMVYNGYLTESRDTILVSVSCANANRASQLQQQVAGMVSDSLEDMIHAGEVLSHQVDKDQKENTEGPFTPGKAAFVQDLEGRYPQLIEDDLEGLTMDEIVTILKTENLDYSDYMDDDHDDDLDDDKDDDHDDDRDDDKDDDPDDLDDLDNDPDDDDD